MKRSTWLSEAESGGAELPFDFDTLVQTYRSRIFRYALLSLRDTDAAETITQDCLMRAYQALGSFRHDCSMKTWLMRIAVNLVRDHIRNRRLQFWKRIQNAPTLALERYTDDRGSGRSPEEAAILRQDAAAVWSAAQKLPDRQRTVFLLRYVEEMDILEITAATGLKEGTVKTHLFRAVRALRAGVEGKR
jgi:RNA polymerase sigma-70 factor (ECF subfamily)